MTAQGSHVCVDHWVLPPFLTDGPKDTKAADVAAKTYIPTLLTFEEEISKGLELMKLAARTSADSKS